MSQKTCQEIAHIGLARPNRPIPQLRRLRLTPIRKKRKHQGWGKVVTLCTNATFAGISPTLPADKS